MSVYKFDVTLEVRPAGGRYEVSAAEEAARVASFVKKVGELAENFSVGETRVEIFPAEK